jgi:cytochrome oxidase Cu insertion factor (SCO1/SenC/PrrC family)
MTQPALARRKLWGMIILFALPALLASGVYLLRDHFNFTIKSEGLLLNPPLALEKLQLKTLAEDPVPADFFADHWWLIYLAPPACTDECGTQLSKLRSVYFSLTKNMPRVKRLMLTPENALTSAQLQLAAQDKPLIIENISNPDYLLSHCSVATTEGIFIMDPHGNIMLCYAPQQEAHAILQDVEKLLKASKIG